MLPVLAKGGFRFKAVSGSDLGKRFGSDLMTDTRGVLEGSRVSVGGFWVRPPIIWAAVCWRKQHTAIAKEAVAAKESARCARGFVSMRFPEGDTGKVHVKVFAKPRPTAGL
jgi:hypothetical protein